MQNSKSVSSSMLPLTGRRIYQWLFVLLLVGMLLTMMFMSNIEESGALETSLYGRFFLIENFNRLRIKLGDRVFPSVLIGQDGWMEYTAEKNLDDYQNALPFSPGQLESIGEQMRSCYQYAEERDITFLIVIAPNKATIYPDKLPPQIQHFADTSRLDQLNDYLRAHNIPEVLDLRPALRDARQTQDVFHKWGTHWNDYGAFIAYETILQSLSKDFPELAPYPAKFFRFRNVPKSGNSREDEALASLIQANYLGPDPTLLTTRDLTNFVRQIDFGNERINYHQITWLPGSDLPTAMVVHDSFGNFGLNKFLALGFSKASYIHRGATHLYLKRQMIEQFAPDIVLYELVERSLDMLLTDLAECAVE